MIAFCINNSSDKNTRLFTATVFYYARQNAATMFIIYTGKDFLIPFHTENITWENILPAKANSFTGKIWYKSKLKKELDRNAVTTLIHNFPFIPMLTAVRQLHWREPIFSSQNSIKETQVFKENNSAVLWVNALEDFKRDPENSFKIYPLPIPVSEEYNNSKRNEKAAGENTAQAYYCLWVNEGLTKEDLLIVIKAFSQFKKRMKSSLRLTLLSGSKNISRLLPDISSYKYRQDLQIIDALSEAEIAQTIKSSFTMLLYHSKPEAHIKPWEIMKAGVPLLCIGADWDIYPKENIPVSIAKNTAESIAGFLIRLYQDEALHKHEKNKGLDFTIGQDVKNTAEALRKIITDAL